MASSKVGTSLPDVTVWEKTPGDAIKIRELCSGKKCVIISVPGAFTPTCSNTHLPAFVEHVDEIKAAGVDLIAFISVNDPFVMSAWGESQRVAGKIRMLADTQMEFAKALDVVLDATAILGNQRSHRFAMIVDDNVIKGFFVEEDPSKMTVSSATSVLKFLKEQ